mgnify:CR=1 FL=1
MIKMEIEEIMIKRISKIGNGAHIVLTKKYVNQKAYVIVFSDDLEEKRDSNAWDNLNDTIDDLGE